MYAALPDLQGQDLSVRGKYQ